MPHRVGPARDLTWGWVPLVQRTSFVCILVFRQVYRNAIQLFDQHGRIAAPGEGETQLQVDAASGLDVGRVGRRWVDGLLSLWWRIRWAFRWKRGGVPSADIRSKESVLQLAGNDPDRTVSFGEKRIAWKLDSQLPHFQTQGLKDLLQRRFGSFWPVMLSGAREWKEELL